MTLVAPDGRRLELGPARPARPDFPEPVKVAGLLGAFQGEELYGIAGGLLWAPGRPDVWAISDESGRFDFSHVPLDARERQPSVLLATSALGYSSEVHGVLAGTADSEARLDLLDLELVVWPIEHRGFFVGRVLGSEAKPLPGAQVHLIQSEAIDARAQLLSGLSPPKGVRSSRTDDLGYFQIENAGNALKDVLVLSEVAAPVFVGGLTPPPPGGEKSVGDLVAGSPRRFEGQVIDGEGPVADVMIAVERSITVGDWSRSFRDQAVGPLATDQEGRFSIPIRGADALPEGVNLLFSKPGYRERTLRRVVVEPDSPADIELELQQVVTGIVTGPHGEPVAGAHIDRVGSGDSPKAGWPEYSSGDAATVLSDDQGFFRIEDLPSAPVVLQVSREGFATRRLRVEPALSPMVEIELAPEAKVVGTVVDAGGAPVVDATIRIGERAFVSDGQGGFEVAGLDSGTWTLEASRREIGWASVEVTVQEGVTRNVHLTLTAPSPASGQVVDERGRPVGGATVLAVDFAGRRAFASSDDRGRFRFSTLKPGTYTLEAKTRRHTTTAVATLLLPEGGTSDWRLEVESLGSISGSLIGVL
ncbi:MAG: carboxypeptidase regulatory-like domain-containing protein, partial [Acidobacteriota bacterium]